jgi:hypothetical protein
MKLYTEDLIKLAETPLDETLMDLRKHRIPSKMKREMRRKYAKKRGK